METDLVDSQLYKIAVIIYDSFIGKEIRYDIHDVIEIIFPKDLYIDRNNLTNIIKLLYFFGLNLEEISKEQALSIFKNLGSSKRTGYKCVTVWFIEKKYNYLLLIIPGDPYFIWYRNYPLTNNKSFILSYQTIPQSELYVEAVNSCIWGWYARLTIDRNRASKFIFKQITPKIYNGQITKIVLENGLHLEVFPTGLYFVDADDCIGWEIHAQNDLIFIDDIIKLTSIKYNNLNLIVSNKNITTKSSDGYWKCQYIGNKD